MLKPGLDFAWTYKSLTKPTNNPARRVANQLVSDRKPLFCIAVGWVEQSVAPRNPSFSHEPTNDGFYSAALRSTHPTGLRNFRPDNSSLLSIDSTRHHQAEKQEP